MSGGYVAFARISRPTAREPTSFAPGAPERASPPSSRKLRFDQEAPMTNLAPAAPPVWVPPSPRPPSRRRRVIIAAVAVAVLGIGVLIARVADRTVLTHDLLETHFTTASAPFVTGVYGDCRYDLTGGTYVVTATKAGAVCSTFGRFVRPAYTVDVRARLANLTEKSRQAAFGIGCMGNKGNDGYVFLASRNNGYAILRVQGGGNRMVAEATDTSLRDRALSLRLTCYASSSGSAVVLTGYVNGVSRVDGTDAEGFNEFDYANLALANAGAGGTATFDDVIARVPGG
jgi:hypothetical protein